MLPEREYFIWFDETGMQLDKAFTNLEKAIEFAQQYKVRFSILSDSEVIGCGDADAFKINHNGKGE